MGVTLCTPSFCMVIVEGVCREPVGLQSSPSPEIGILQQTVSSFRSQPLPGKLECRVGQYVVDLASFEQLALPVLRNVSTCFLS